MRAKQIHDEVREFVDPDILELRQKKWNTSVLVPKKPDQDETFERKLIKVAIISPQPILKCFVYIDQIGIIGPTET